MTEVSQHIIFERLQQALKKNAMTYAMLAQKMGVSEPTIKRLFIDKDCKLSRLNAICTALNITLDELINAPASISIPVALDKETEDKLADNPALFFIFILLIEQFTPKEIARHYKLTEKSLFRYLRLLEELKLITLEPDMQIKIRTALPIKWRHHGALFRIIKNLNKQFLEQVMQRHNKEFDCQFITLSRGIHPTSLALLQEQLVEFQKQYMQLAYRDQRLYPHTKLISTKWTSALSPVDFTTLFHIP